MSSLLFVWLTITVVLCQAYQRDELYSKYREWSDLESSFDSNNFDLVEEQRSAERKIALDRVPTFYGGAGYLDYGGLGDYGAYGRYKYGSLGRYGGYGYGAVETMTMEDHYNTRYNILRSESIYQVYRWNKHQSVEDWCNYMNKKLEYYEMYPRLDHRGKVTISIVDVTPHIY